MRILIRTSHFAIWARRFGEVALPLAIIPVLLHRERLVSTDAFLAAEAIAIAAALAAIACAMIAFVRLWISGDKGWSRATAGLLLGALCLLPPAYLGWEMVRYPDVSGFSTDRLILPTLVVAPVPRLGSDRAAVEAAFPNARSRRYTVDAARIFALALEQVTTSGWDVRRSVPPAGTSAPGQINAIATRLLGWQDEVSIRIVEDQRGTEVDMASAGLHPIHDLGENGKRIEAFLAALDDAVTRLMRETPSAPAEPASETAPAQPPAVGE
ncbi:Protein of unknown function [Devosia enhydra]|uniref:DUF1499 domain-containing protein n=1 Tax=Devosia enhydra TaxID=665118 RepID=A0A1K2I1C2_9HYPH|nr:DUF1499 domain-containing protein [Devosia enhydra]SFZ86055.1 Protein of unknown function [Devosia enhydra]